MRQLDVGILEARARVVPIVARVRVQGKEPVFKMRLVVTTMVVSCLSLVGLAVTTGLTASYTGPSYTSASYCCMASLCLLIVWSALRLCCRFRGLVLAAMVYVGVSIACSIVWTTHVQKAAEYNCSSQMGCELVLPSDQYGCESDFVVCQGPKLSKDKYFYSQWEDDCTKTCRGFHSKADCVNFKNPSNGEPEDCGDSGTTAKEFMGALAGVYTALALFAAIPAFLFIVSTKKQRRRQHERLPSVELVELAKGDPVL